MPKPKKLMFRQMQQFDLDNEESFVRLIEMTVDSMTGVGGIRIQFWKDVQVYGIDEAVLYLRGYLPDADFTELERAIAEMRTAMEQTPA